MEVFEEVIIFLLYDGTAGGDVPVLGGIPDECL
jgi:hypothetical protein